MALLVWVPSGAPVPPGATRVAATLLAPRSLMPDQHRVVLAKHFPDAAPGTLRRSHPLEDLPRRDLNPSAGEANPSAPPQGSADARGVGESLARAADGGGSDGGGAREIERVLSRRVRMLPGGQVSAVTGTPFFWSCCFSRTRPVGRDALRGMF